MKSFFAPAERTDPAELDRQIGIVANNPVANGLLKLMRGLLAVLNSDRQIVAINGTFLDFLGIDDPGQVLGLRPGEAVRCVHAKEEPGGCGTSRHCATCGAAVAIVSSLGQNQPAERTCALTAEVDGIPTELALLVRSSPILIQDQKYVLLFLEDISGEQQRANLERSFFHDMSNTMAVLSGACGILEEDGYDDEVVRQIINSSDRLVREFDIQRRLTLGNGFDFPVKKGETEIGRIFGELEDHFDRHPAAQNRILEFPAEYPSTPLQTDLSLCLRVLTNMVVNALEASEEKGLVDIWLEERPDSVVFCVWNDQVIPEDRALRIFQRNFSTKEGLGRGFGTYSMKLFGEDYLGGKVSFQSPERGGTVFRLELPIGGGFTGSSV